MDGGQIMRWCILAFAQKKATEIQIDDVIGLSFRSLGCSGTFGLDIVCMSYEWMKFCFSNFIHQLPLMKVSDDKIQAIFEKLVEASIRWCISFRLKIDIY